MSPQQTNRDSAIPTAVSGWRKETLDLFNVEYDFHSVTYFTFDGLMLPGELQNGNDSFN